MVWGIALALTLTSGLASGGGWAQRLADAQAHSPCEVESLLETLERACAVNPLDHELLRVRFDAAFWLLVADESELCCERSIDVRLARARRCAREAGPAAGDAVLEVESEQAFTLLARADAREAAQLLLAALQEFPDAERARPDALFLLGRASASVGDTLAARGAYEEGIDRLEARTALARAAGDRDAIAYSLELRCDALEDMVRLSVDLGLIDPAAELLDLLVESSNEAASASSRQQADLAACVFALAVRDPSGLLEHARSGMRAAASEAERATFALYELTGLVEHSRDGHGDVAVAAATLEEFPRSDVAGSAAERERAVEVSRLAFDFALLRGDLVAARSAETSLSAALASAASVVQPSKLARWRLQAATLRGAMALAGDAGSRDLTRARDELASRFDEFLAAQLRLSIVPGGIGYLHWGDRRRVLSELIRLELALDSTSSGTLRAFTAVLRAQDLGSFGREAGAGGTSLEEVRSVLLGPDTGLLVWLPSLERSHLFVVDRQRIECFELGSRDELLLAAEEYADLALTPPRGDRRERDARCADLLDRGEALRDSLLPADVRSRMEAWRGLYASGLELCENTLFECLPWQEGSSVGSRFAAARVPSVPVAVWLAKRAGSPVRAARTAGSVVLAGSRHGALVRARWPELDPIRMTGAERDAIARSGGGSTCEFLLDESATRARLRAACARRPALLELFTHGVYGVDRFRPAGLILGAYGSESGLLGCAEIEHFGDMAAIVALYACGSARGPTRLGDDNSTQIANAFLRADADCVLLSRGEVAYEASLEISRLLRCGLFERGLTPAEAVAFARGELAESERWSDVYFQASLALVGLGLDPATRVPGRTAGATAGDPPSVGRFGWLVLAGLVALAGAGVARSIRR
jgi:hypothetical protein